jgi:hypothetical protein
VNSTGFKQNEQEFLRDPLTRGFLAAHEFEAVTETGLTDKQVLQLHHAQEHSDSNSKDDEEGSTNDVVDTNELMYLQQELFDPDSGSCVDSTQQQANDYSKLLVCQHFLRKECTQTTCLFAHPGIRDKAKVAKVRVPGTLRKVPFVRICPHFSLTCQTCTLAPSNSCPYYHIYLRPSTRELILKLYPLQQGIKVKTFISGARHEGHVRGARLNGYGVMTWGGKAQGHVNTKAQADAQLSTLNGAVYIGDFKDDLRDGLGIFRCAHYEYVGTWSRGMKNGWGVMLSPNEEEYTGEFVDGWMEGIGRLINYRTGDVYEGCFERNKYHGLGKFVKKNGDTYLGYSEKGYAHGLGILKVFTGECYRGYFDRNFRHGQGVAKYANGSKYAGNWYRGVPDGFGLYIAPSGELLHLLL